MRASLHLLNAVQLPGTAGGQTQKMPDLAHSGRSVLSRAFTQQHVKKDFSPLLIAFGFHAEQLGIDQKDFRCARIRLCGQLLAHGLQHRRSGELRNIVKIAPVP